MCKDTTKNSKTKKISKKTHLSVQNIFSSLKLKVSQCFIQGDTYYVEVYSEKKHHTCPYCGHVSSKCHSKYTRTLCDLPILEYKVKIIFHIRKIFCLNQECAKKTFAERPCEEIQPYQKNTQRLKKKIISLAGSMSSNLAQKHLQLFDRDISSSTILRYLHQVEVPKQENVTKIGVDDWAKRKGISYGSIIINLITMSFIGLIDGRDKEHFAEWLKQYPDIDTVSRDRASAYTAAIADINKSIVEIADRFHLLKNMSDCIRDVLKEKRKDYQEVIRKLQLAEYLKNHPNATCNDQLSLYRDNVYYDFFVNQLSLTQIHTQLKNKGILFTKEEFLSKFGHLTKWKKRIIVNSNSQPPSDILPLYSPSDFSIIIEQHIRGNKVSESALCIIEELMKNQWFKCIYDATNEFIKWMNHRDTMGLTNWVKQHIYSPLKPLKTLAKGIENDFDAVNNALLYDYSNGVVEGYVNKLKAIKRTMYGRASIKLLEKKMFLVDNKYFQLS